MREDRGSCQMKTARGSRSFAHAW